MKVKILFAIYILAAFYGTNWLAQYLLPKWVDFFIGFPFSIYLIWKGMVYFEKYL